jgi:hypothetical protein
MGTVSIEDFTTKTQNHRDIQNSPALFWGGGQKKGKYGHGVKNAVLIFISLLPIWEIFCTFVKILYESYF